MTTNELRRSFIGMRETDLTDSQKAVLLVIATDAACDLETIASGILETELKTRPIVRLLILAGLVHKSKLTVRTGYNLTNTGSDLITAWLVGKTLTEFAKASRHSVLHDFSNARKKPFQAIPPLPPKQ